MSLVGSLRGVQAKSEPCNSDSNSIKFCYVLFSMAMQNLYLHKSSTLLGLSDGLGVLLGVCKGPAL